MGHNTSFNGAFTITPALDAATLALFSEVLSEDTRDIKKEDADKFNDDFPGYFCDFVPSSDGTKLEHNGAEKSYEQQEWIQWLIDNVFKPRGFTLNGSVAWQGDDYKDDVGLMEVKDNVLTVDDWGERFKKAKSGEK